MSPDRPPRYAFYAETCFHRTEHFLHDQILGLAGADVRAVARWGANLDEFPVPSLHLVEEFRTVAARCRNAVRRRLLRGGSGFGRLPGYAAGSIARHLRREAVSLVYCLFGWHATQLLDVLDRLPRRLPLVFLAGGSDVTAAASFGDDYVTRLRLAFDRATWILCGSEFLKGRLIELGAPASRVRVHYIGVDIPPETPARPGRRGGPFRALAVSRLSAVKGVPHTIRAFARVAAELPDARLDVIGDGEDRADCEALIARLGLADRIRLRGSMPLGAVHEAMKAADVFLQHNVRTPEGREESLGGSILEAAARRLPVVVAGSGGVSEAVEHGRTGFVVSPGDERAMALAILRIAQNPEEAARLGEAGRSLVAGRFDIRAQNARLGEILKVAATGDVQ